MLRLLQTNLLLTCLVLAIVLALALLLWALFRSDKSKTQPNPRNIKEEELQAKLVNAFLDLSLQPQQNQVEEALSHSLSRYLMADLLGILHYEPLEKQLNLIAPYDLIREEHNYSILLRAESLPHLLQKFTSNEPLISNNESELKGEKAYLMEAIGYNQLGRLLLYPLKSVPNQPEWAILALSPYTNKAWQASDLEKLDGLQDNLRRVLDGATQLEVDARQIENLRALLAESEKEVAEQSSAFAESEKQASELRQSLQETQKAWEVEIADWAERQKSFEAELEALQKTIAANEAELAGLEKLRLEKKQLEERLNRNSEQTSRLKNTIDQASQLLEKLSDQTKTVDEERP